MVPGAGTRLALLASMQLEEKRMQILINSDHHITGDEILTERVEALVEDSLGRFGERITRVEVHLNDVNGDKLGDRDKRCMMEARLGGLKPIAVSHQAGTLQEAMDAAAEKLERAIERTLGRLADSEGRGPSNAEVASIEDLERLRDLENPSPGSGQ
jgi:ribosome-associated translation inhibitor RaiA